MMHKNRLLVVSFGLLGLLCASFASAYSIVFTDDSVLVVLGKYKVIGDKALVTLPSGTQTTFDLREIDVKRTDEVNRMGVTRGVVVDRGETTVLVPSADTSSQSVADLARRFPLVDFGQRQSERTDIRRTFAGNLDLFSLERKAPTAEGALATMRRHLEQHAVRVFAIIEGTNSNRLLLDLTTNSSVEVFKALAACAEALSATRSEHPNLEAVEIIMSTTERSRAGQFLLIPDAAEALRAEQLSPAEFFVENVQF